MVRKSETVSSPPPPTALHPRESRWRRVTNIFWGYDFFISYQWTSGGLYAASLAARLHDRGYDCFLDRAEFAVGDEWRAEAAGALRRTQRLVIIATHDAIAHSSAVQHELQLFSSRKHRIIPIMFGARFSGEDRAQYSALRLIPEDTLDIIETVDNLERGPSDDVLTKLVLSHRILRRRQIRLLAVLATFLLLSIMLLTAVDFAIRAEQARKEAERQKLLVESAELVSRADLLRETEGPKLDESLKLGVAAYEKAQRAGGAAGQAERVIKQALDLTPERIGEAWTAFGRSVPLKFQAVGSHIVVMRKDPPPRDEPFAIVAKVDKVSQKWSIVRSYSETEHGELLHELVTMSNSPRWLFTTKNARTIIWDVEKEQRHAELPFAHMPDENGGDKHGSAELLAVSATGKAALARTGTQLTLWNMVDASPKAKTLPITHVSSARYALSPSGKWLAWAAQNEFTCTLIEAPERAIHYPVTNGGGQIEALGFAGESEEDTDQIIFVSWGANQVMAEQAAARRDSPSIQAAVWRLAPYTPNAFNPSPPSISPPDSVLVRAGPFELAFGGDLSPELAVLDPDHPVQWLDMESQISFALGANAGAATKGLFSPLARQFLAVHKDGTARLWDLTTQAELRRFTATAAIESAAFLVTASENSSVPREVSTIVTLDRNGQIQAWSATKTATAPVMKRKGAPLSIQ